MERQFRWYLAANAAWFTAFGAQGIVFPATAMMLVLGFLLARSGLWRQTTILPESPA